MQCDGKVKQIRCVGRQGARNGSETNNARTVHINVATGVDTASDLRGDAHIAIYQMKLEASQKFNFT